MISNKNIGLIDCSSSGRNFQNTHLTNLTGYNIKKIMVSDYASTGIVQSQFPEVEIVLDKNDILNDGSIELVILSAPKEHEISLVGEILQSGKQVRIL